MKVIGGDWKNGSAVSYSRGVLKIQKSTFSVEAMLLMEIERTALITEENRANFGKTMGWGLAGALVLGPVGAILGGMAARGKEQALAVLFKDGRKLLLSGSAKELMEISAAGFQFPGDAASERAQSGELAPKADIPPVSEVWENKIEAYRSTPPPAAHHPQTGASRPHGGGQPTFGKRPNR
ncbi:hypothetical protein [Mesorhizobium sp. M1B.F.Ca.ET.045.04.1.1]|uniref:hypothetical protein n=1 Tax=Mesorhizobium sp. M1B.F.Ca.ET.045.04.1.1 TaxID=2493673 RepID=UPI000F761025|nr:hypothetical protein [Mesorhizobium sp. M1B.F.Ca.ET.045.04.1.1]AZO32429.1 hypothetical protein EJ071_37205 [Mesorhizobium sp. M1B.F.Ca.ET.045.04.1.1]